MYKQRALNHTSLNLILFFSALIIGLLLGSTLPLPWVGSIFSIGANISFRIMLYFTIPYLFFSLLISSYELIKTHHFMTILKLISKSGLLISVVLVACSIAIFVFLPNQNIISFFSEQSDIERISASSIISNIFTFNWNNTIYASQVLIIPFFVLAIILGVSANNIMDAHHPFLEVCNGLRAINLKILETLFPWYSVGILTMSAYNIASLRNFEHIELFYSLILFLLILGVVLTLGIYPLLFKVLGVPVQYFTWCQQIIPAVALAFAGGNMTTASLSLLYVEDLNNSRHKLTDTTIALSFIFARAGTALTIALSYIVVNKIYTAIPLSIVQLAIILVASISFAFLSNAIFTPIIITGIITISKIPSTAVHELYLAVLPLSIILHSLSTAIDIVTSGYLKLFIANEIHKTNIGNDRTLFNQDKLGITER